MSSRNRLCNALGFAPEKASFSLHGSTIGTGVNVNSPAEKEENTE